MADAQVKLSVFTKPWKNISIAEMGKKMSGLGFDGIEFPLREGYQISPDNAEKGLPQLVRELGDYGLSVYSIASTPNEHVFAGCAAASIPIIRVMTRITEAEGYLASEQRERRYLESLLPLCEKYGVKVGVQQHYGDCVIDSSGMLHLLEGLDSRYIGAIWDAAHDGLTGQRPEYGLDIVWSHLCMVNLKNAFYRQTNGPEAEQMEWGRYFTLGRHGMASWSRIADYLKKRAYNGAVTLTAEYTDEHNVDAYIALDIAYVKSLFNQ